VPAGGPAVNSCAASPRPPVMMKTWSCTCTTPISEDVLVAGLGAASDDACYRAMDWLETRDDLEKRTMGPGLCWPGNTNDSALIRQVKDDMRDWCLSVTLRGPRQRPTSRTRRTRPGDRPAHRARPLPADGGDRLTGYRVIFVLISRGRLCE
jgi:hypothetical protein